MSDDPPKTKITSIQQVDYAGKANKRTMESTKSRIVAIAGLRDFLSTYKASGDKEKRRSLNL